MRITSIVTSATIAGIAVAIIALTTGAADAAKAGRDAAIEKCVAYAQQNAGITGGARTALYKDCMTHAGHRP
jgi:uncharacterized membrane protein